MTRKAIYPIVLGATLGAAGLAGTLHESREPAAAASVASQKPLYYRCPMHPAITSDKPGTASCCGMDLEPVYAPGASPAAPDGSRQPTGAVVVTAEQQHLIGVKVAPVEEASGSERLRLYGRVVPDERSVRKVTVGAYGFVRETSDVTTGSRVRKGQLLATYSTLELRQQIAAYISAVDVLDREQASGKANPAQVAAAAAGSELALDRLLGLGMSPHQLEEIRRTKSLPVQIHVTSPIDGILIARNVFAGQRVEEGTELFQIADLRRVWIVAEVQGAQAERLGPGTAADITVAGRTLRARVTGRALPQFDPATQLFTLRLEVDNPALALRPDMFVDVNVEAPYDSTLSIPRDAVVASGLRNSVFVEHGAGVFEPREVKTGRWFGDRVQVLEGLAPGERIAVSGTFLLDSESRMRVR